MTYKTREKQAENQSSLQTVSTRKVESRQSVLREESVSELYQAEASPERIIMLAERLKSLANPVRLCLLLKLARHEDLGVSYFTHCMSASQSTISQHLGKLRDLGIVHCRREGSQVKYSLTDPEVRQMIELLFPKEESHE